MAEPRTLGYDSLHDYLTSSACIEQGLAEDYYEEASSEVMEAAAVRHWAKAEAYREVVKYIESDEGAAA